jgi:hypothetical protein
MADKIKFIEGTNPARPGAFHVKGSDALKPGAALAIFERLVGRPATAEERAEVEQDEEPMAEGDGPTHTP